MSEKQIPTIPLTPEEQVLIDAVDGHRGELIELVKKLVSIDSRNYSLEVFSDMSAIVSFVESFMKDAGASCEIFRCPHPAPVPKPGQKGSSVLFCEPDSSMWL